VSRAIQNITGEIASLLVGFDALDQRGLDAGLRSADGTSNLGRLGGNATLAVSLAAARATALATGEPLFRRLASIAATIPTLPMPMVNILSGGLHARRGMDIQDFLMIPVGASSYSQALQWASRVRSAAAQVCEARGITTLLADEGGLSPGFETTEEALELMLASFEHAGLSAGDEVAIALDVAASSLVDGDGRYQFKRQQRIYDANALIDLLRRWTSRYPIISIEDGLGEDAWDSWADLTRALGGIQLIGDDLFATQPDRIATAVRSGVANSALIKVNQNGTLSGALDAVDVARRAGYATVISARSGESEDSFMADLAVGINGGQIKIGSVRSSERLAKYNQLLRLEEHDLPWSGRAGIAPL
jgi:enolase